ncbi:MAG: hypothetical protein ABI790_15760 [Betaproteobacteria bacterium]
MAFYMFRCRQSRSGKAICSEGESAAFDAAAFDAAAFDAAAFSFSTCANAQGIHGIAFIAAKRVKQIVVRRIRSSLSCWLPGRLLKFSVFTVFVLLNGHLSLWKREIERDFSGCAKKVTENLPQSLFRKEGSSSQ